jgi:archaellum biogenesis ATPase FlaH
MENSYTEPLGSQPLSEAISALTNVDRFAAVTAEPVETPDLGAWDIDIDKLLTEEKPEFLATRGNVDTGEYMVFAMRKALTLISADPGAGKSSLLALILADAKLKGRKVLYLDTEMRGYPLRRQIEKIAACRGVKPQELPSQGIRLTSSLPTIPDDFARNYSERQNLASNIGKTLPPLQLDYLSAIAHEYRPDLIIIDNLRDLLEIRYGDNEEQSVRDLITELLRLAEDVGSGVVVINHNNKAGATKGHVGSIALQKCDIEINLKKEGNVAKVSYGNKGYREGRTDVFCSFTWDTMGIPQWNGEGVELSGGVVAPPSPYQTREYWAEQLRKLGKSPGVGTFTRSEYETIASVKRSQAQTNINIGIASSVIETLGSGRSQCYRLTTPEDDESDSADECPF